MRSGNTADRDMRSEASRQQGSSTNDSVAAFILAGGRGERLGVLSEHRAKPALPFAGHRPLIDLAVQNCVRSGIGSVGVLAEYRWRSVQRALQSGMAASSGDITVDLRVSAAGSGTGAAQYRGTADAVRQNLDLVGDHDSVVILAGDHVYSMNYAPLVEARRSSGADIAIALTEVSKSDISRFGIVHTHGDRVVAFEEKPEDSASTLASMGIYVFDAQVLRRLLEEDGTLKSGSHDFGHDILPRALACGLDVLGYTFDGYWRDVGTPAAYWAASMDLLGPEPLFPLDDPFHGLLRPSTAGAVRFGASGHARNSLLTGACTIEGLADRCVVSPGVWIAEGAVVRNSVLLPGARVGPGALVDRAILDEDASIGAGAIVGLSARGFRGLLHRNVDEPTVIGRSARIEGGVTVEPHAVVPPLQARTRSTARVARASSNRRSAATASPSS